MNTTLTHVAKHVAGTIVVNELLNNGPSVIDKAELIMTDAETEGKKRGFERASAEYEPAYKILEKEYEAAIKLLAKERDLYDSTLEELAEKLRCLEAEQQALRMEADVMEERISRLYDIPVEEIKRGFNGNGRENTIGLVFPILDLLYVYKKNKLKRESCARKKSKPHRWSMNSKASSRTGCSTSERRVLEMDSPFCISV